MRSLARAHGGGGQNERDHDDAQRTATHGDPSGRGRDYTGRIRPRSSMTVRETLGRYQVLGPIGSGGMGEVFVARDPSLGRKVAIKMLPVRMASDRDTLSRFTQEARSASALNHPNIITIHEVGTDERTPFIVMEYVEGRDLRSLLNAGK